jgi:8-oxo-dGTP pyrophosphatase MutT (NUDIX family)
MRLEEIREQLAAHRPERLPPEGRRRAAVAVVLHEEGVEGPHVVLIERAHHPADPWSGHMAFPGGRVQADDPSDRHAAERETEEEVGVSLAGADYLGVLADLEGRYAGRPAGLVISAHVYALDERRALVPNYEVETAFWFPVEALSDPERQVDYRHPQMRSLRFPGIRVGDPDRHIVWGLTYRFLELFLHLAGTPLPERGR